MSQGFVKVSKKIARTLIAKSSFLKKHRQWVYVRTQKEQSSFANRKAETNSKRAKKPTTQRFSTKVWEFQYIQPTDSNQKTHIIKRYVAQNGKKIKVYRKIINKHQLRGEGSIQLPARVSRLGFFSLRPTG